MGPALSLAGRAYREAVLSYDAFDEHNAAVLPAIERGFAEVLSTRGTFELWAATKGFEGEFARWCGRRRAVGVASGTAALQLALVAAGVGPGDEVVTSAHTFIATVLAIHNTGARPVLVDPEPGDLCMGAEAVGRALSPRTRAIVPVHMHGHVADMDGILALAKERRLVVIEDCAQAHGATLRGVRVPVGGTGCFSFYATKPLGGAGNGGMVVTDDEALAERVERARDPEGGDPVVLAAARTPSYLNALDAAVLAARLPKLEDWGRERAANAHAYDAALAGEDTLRPRPGVESAWYSYVVRVDGRDEVSRRMLLRGVETRVEYHPSLLLSPTFAAMGWEPRRFPVAMDASARGLSLPVRPFLGEAGREAVTRAFRAARR